MSYETNKNPFFDPDEDVTDETFLSYRNPNRVLEERLLKERRQLEDQVLKSSSSAIRAMLEAEEIGTNTAEKLVHQGEQLRKVDRNLDDLNSMTKITQKHLTAMKSVFTGFKSYFGRSSTADGSGSTNSQTATSPESESSQKNGLLKIVTQFRNDSEMGKARNNQHLRARNLNDTSGFGAAFDDDDDDNADANNGDSFRTASAMTRSQMVEKKLEADFLEISQGLTRLTLLASGLNTELDDQLSLLDNIACKTDLAEGTIAFQNNQMNRLLKK
ncbi:synaptosomal-associated protein 29-like [Varroa destructor]|uniref:t-SNARE coiled-coil homology domain-containing protein n=1 Tax=Varroa destructor TaxID=109461 RepID=A0A7M7JXQ9_VARDE|nr:synaptosomal-associated protein 29-like [Varroa destructor]XP_022658073.1 synaptosomal-associated protein 29-like [Varroa destructor]